MVYNGFYYSLKAARAIDIIHYYTTNEDVSRFHGVRMALSNCRLVLGFAAILSHMTSTFLLATQDNVEFMMKFCEDIVLSQTFFEYLLLRFGVQKFIKLIDQSNEIIIFNSGRQNCTGLQERRKELVHHIFHPHTLW